jgi:hypothetical protein
LQQFERCRCRQLMPQRPHRTIKHHRLTAHRDPVSGGRRKVCGMRESRASHSQPAVLGEAVSPLFPRRRHSAILNAAAASEKGGIWAERRARRAKLWGVWTLAAMCRPTPASSPPACANQKPLGSGDLVRCCRSLSFVVVVFVLVSRLSPVECGRFNVDVCLGVWLGVWLRGQRDSP